MQNEPTTSPDTEKNNLLLGEGARALVTVAAAMVVIYGLQQARSVILPIMMACFLAIISYTVTGLLRRFLRFPHWLAVSFTVLADFGVIFGIISLFNVLIRDVKQTLEGEVTTRLMEKYNEIMGWLGNVGLEEQARDVIASPMDIINIPMLLSWVQTLSGQVLSFVSACTLVLLLMTFILGEATLFGRNFRSLPNSNKGKDDFLNALRGIQRYLFIKTVASTSTGLLAWWLCAAMEVPFAFMWGMLALVLNFIPTIGSIVAAIPPILMALLMGGWGDCFIVAVGYIAINFAIGNGIEPIFLGKQFGIATSVVLVSVLFWGWVWGPCGMLLAMPITVLIKLACENSRDLTWVATIIEDRPPITLKKNP